MQGELFYETEYDALRTTVDMLGGAKAVGHELWPSKTIPEAQRRMLHCIDPEREQKLSLDEFFHIWRMARAKGIHALAEYVGMALDYEVKPITVEQKQAAICEQYKQVCEQFAKIAPALGFKVEPIK